MNTSEASWKKELDELEAFFKKVKNPGKPIKFAHCYTVKNVKGYVESEINSLRHNDGKSTFNSGLDRLRLLKKHLETL